MSSLGRWSYTNVATVTPYLGEDLENGGTLYGEPYEIACTFYAEPEQMRDKDGAEFVTRGAVVCEDKRPQYRDLVECDWKIGKCEIRSIGQYDVSMFGEPDSPDFVYGVV